MKEPKRVYLDMDGPLADFEGHLEKLRGKPGPFEWNPPEMFRGGFFRALPITAGAETALPELWRLDKKGLIHLCVATKHTTKNVYSAAEKLMWIEEHFPKLLRRTMLTFDKSLLYGDFLVDDDPERWKNFKGKVITFDRLHPEESWEFALREIYAAVGEK